MQTFANQVSGTVQVNCSEGRSETKRNSDKAVYFRVPKFSHSSGLRINKEQDNSSTKQCSYHFFLGGYEKKHPKLQTFQKILPKKLAGTKTLHEEKLYDLYRPLSAFSTIIHFVSVLRAENNCKLSVRSRLTGYHETRMFIAVFTTAPLLSY